MQRIGFACGQFPFNFVRLIRRSPFFYYIAVFVNHLQGCSWYFLIASDVLLADGNLCGIILHDYNAANVISTYGDLAVFCYSKGNGFCYNVAIRCSLFSQGIGTCIQFHNLCSLAGCPLFNYSTLCICNLKGCPFQFFCAIDRLFADGNLSLFCISHRHFCYLTSSVNCKGDGFCFLVTARGCSFYQLISTTGNQFPMDHMCFIGRSPTVNQCFYCFTSCIFCYVIQFQFCSCQFLRTSQSLLADTYLRHIILHHDCAVFIQIGRSNCNRSVLVNRKGNVFCIRIAIWCTRFLERIGFTDGKFAAVNLMICTIRRPFLYQVILSVPDFQFCVLHFCFACNVLLCDYNILNGNGCSCGGGYSIGCSGSDICCCRRIISCSGSDTCCCCRIISCSGSDICCCRRIISCSGSDACCCCIIGCSGSDICCCRRIISCSGSDACCCRIISCSGSDTCCCCRIIGCSGSDTCCCGSGSSCCCGCITHNNGCTWYHIIIIPIIVFILNGNGFYNTIFNGKGNTFCLDMCFITLFILRYCHFFQNIGTIR